MQTQQIVRSFGLPVNTVLILCFILEVDYIRVTTFVIGVSLFLLSPVLASNPFFYYLTGITVGVSASVLILVYFFIKLLPLKVSIYYDIFFFFLS